MIVAEYRFVFWDLLEILLVGRKQQEPFVSMRWYYLHRYCLVL